MERSRPLVGRLRRPVAAIAALTIGLSLALSVPPGAQAEPKKSPGRRQDGRTRDHAWSAVLDQEARHCNPRPRQDQGPGAEQPARLRSAPLARCSRSTTTTASSTARPTHSQAVGAKIEVWVANDTSFPAGDCRAGAERHDRHAGPGAVPRRPVRQQHVPEGVAGLQRRARSRRQRQRRQRHRLDRRRRQDHDAGRQRPRRQLLPRPERRADLHRGLLLLPDQRAARPQRHDDRRVRLAAPHDGEPARRPDHRPVHQPAGPAVPVRGHVRARVPAPARVLPGPERGQLGERRPVRLRARP